VDWTSQRRCDWRGLFAQTGFAQEPAPPAKPDSATAIAKSAANAKSVTGKWTLAIDTPIGLQTSLLTIVLNGKKLTGTVSREDHQAANKVAGGVRRREAHLHGDV
jgi:hypothetical protein